MSQTSRIGSTMAGYRIEGLLGRGGMGTVYLAQDLNLGRKVALKVLSPELAADPRFRDRFVRESRIAASLEDPNVIPIYESGEVDGELFIVMRYVPGKDLKALVQQEGPLPPERTVSIVSQVASALDAAHAQGLVHRDVKPANILLVPASERDRQDKVYLSDFGLTKRASSDSGLTATGQFVGTLDYAAPEQFQGTPLTPRTDVYSLGCVLFECLTGEVPFPKEQDAARMFAHLKEEPPKVTASRPELPQAIDPVVRKAMAKSPEERFGTAGALAAASASALHVTPSRATLPRRLVFFVAAALALAALVATLQLTLGHGGPARVGSNPGSPAVPPDNSVVEVDPDTGRIEATITGLAAGSSEFPARHIEVGEGGVWVDTAITLQHIDPSSGKVVARIQAQGALATIAVGQGAIWAAGNLGISRISPATDQVEATIPFETEFSRPVTLVIHGGDVWVLVNDGRLIRIDAGRNTITKRLATAGGGEDLCVGEGALWAVDSLLEQVTQLDWTTGHILTHIHVAGKLDRVVAGLGAVWVLDEDAGVVTPIDTATLVPAAPIRVGEKPVDMAIGLGAVWVLNRGDGSITRIDSITHVTSTIEVGGPVASIAIDAARKTLWVYLTQ